MTHLHPMVLFLYFQPATNPPIMKKTFFINAILLLSLSIDSFSQEIVNHRSFQTTVKNQGQRGSCTAFGVAAALEILPGVPADISEQYLYASLLHSRKGKVEAGGFLREYPALLSRRGFIHEDIMPYDPRQILWSDQTPAFVNVIAEAGIDKAGLNVRQYWAKYYIDQGQFLYFERQQAADPEQIKNLLRSGQKAIAASYVTHKQTWDNHAGNPLIPMQPNMAVWLNGQKLSYGLAKLNYLNGDLATDIANGSVAYELVDTTTVNNRGEIVSSMGGHVVTIVGYNPYGFIIKNSWGTDWGNFGYGFISYDMHRLYCTESLSFREATLVQPLNQTPLRFNHELRLKTTLMGKSTSGQSSELQLSLFTTDMLSDPYISSVEFYLYDRNGNQLAKTVGLSNIVSQTYNGFTAVIKSLLPLEVLGGQVPMQVKVVFDDNATNLKRTIYYPQVYYRTAEYMPAR